MEFLAAAFAALVGLFSSVVGMAVSIVVHFIICYLFKRVCQRCGHNPGILIWIPLLNLIPLFRAGRLPLLLLLTLIIAPLFVIVWIVLWWKLSERCGKPGWLALLWLVPPLGIVHVLYLALVD